MVGQDHRKISDIFHMQTIYYADDLLYRQFIIRTISYSDDNIVMAPSTIGHAKSRIDIRDRISNYSRMQMHIYIWIASTHT